MQTFETPRGEAGSDQLIAMEESIRSQLEQMFDQKAKRDSIALGLSGRLRSDFADEKIRIDARIRECEALMTFHAGRALELALHVLYARGTNRILGREFCGMTQDQKDRVVKDRKSHSLSKVYQLILEDVADEDIKIALEDRYQKSLHEGMIDVTIDDELNCTFLNGEDIPFGERVMGGLVDGTEKTFDQSDAIRSVFPRVEESGFSKMSSTTFEEFLKKADLVYYGQNNARWAHYTARDHQYGRQYIVVGTKFFARLVKRITALSGQAWVWDEKLLRRFIARREYLLTKRVETLLMQNFSDAVELPSFKSEDEVIEHLISLKDAVKTPETALNLTHQKWMFNTR